MTEVKYNKSHHAGGTPEARVRARLRNSGEGSGATHTTQQGESPGRVFHNIHESAGQGGGGGAGPDYANDIEARVAEDHRRKRAEGRC
jgi:hypothetical protein